MLCADMVEGIEDARGEVLLHHLSEGVGFKCALRAWSAGIGVDAVLPKPINRACCPDDAMRVAPPW